jgi:formylglycine-generating enzyme required for sulfatase activity
MADTLVGILKQLDLDIDDENIAEWMWLATKIEIVAEEKAPPSKSEADPNGAGKLPKPPSGTAGETKKDRDQKSEDDDAVPLTQESGSSQKVVQAGTQRSQGIPFKVAAAPALRNPLQIGRSFRPLMKKVQSRTEAVLEEERTAEQLVLWSVFMPVLDSASEKWLEVALVVEEYRSTVIWERRIRAFQKLVERQGAFRDVRTWSLDTENIEKFSLYPRRSGATVQKSGGSRHTPKELIDPSGRRLILIVSDCTSPAWRTGKIYELLNDWAEKQPVTVVQLLPERLWKSTGLGRQDPVYINLKSWQEVVTKALMQDEDFPFWEKRPKRDLKLPVITLEPDVIMNWAQMLSGSSDRISAGFVIDLDAEAPVPLASSAQSKLNSEELVRRFQSTASLTARRLAGLVAGAPISIPIVHLIQASLLPESDHVHVAEVMMSGLIRRRDISKNDRDPDTIQYEFVDGYENSKIREFLADSVGRTRLWSVFIKVSEYIQKKAGVTIDDFQALLKPNLLSDLGTHPDIVPFAQITRQVLKRMGGAYAELVKKLENSDAVPWMPEGFPKVKTFEYKVGKVVIITEPKPDQLDQVTFENYDFEVVTINPDWRVDFVFEEVYALLNRAIAKSTNYALTPVDKAILEGTFSNKSYAEITAAGYSASALQRAAKLLWSKFSEFLIRPTSLNRPPVTKRTVKKEILRWWFYETGLQKTQKRNRGFKEQLPGGIDLEMMEIPAGEFLMGSPESEPERHSDESPQHPVSVNSFYLGRYPITQAQWKAVTALPQIEIELNPDPSHFKGDNRPVERISRYEAKEFCARLTEKTKRLYRLPTEAEWEYACRAGTTTPFHFGENITPDLANYDGNYTYQDGLKGEFREETTPVNHFDFPNAFGLHDMHGNVWEWCEDHWHDDHSEAPTDGKARLAGKKDTNRVLRGGSWNLNPRYCRSAIRFNAPPDLRDHNIGLRVVCSLLRT